MVEHPRTSWIDSLSIAISRVAMFIIAFIVLIMFYEVVMRYVFQKPTLWVNEMSLWTAGMVYLLAGVYVMQQRGHIRIFILYDMVPRDVQSFIARSRHIRVFRSWPPRPQTGNAIRDTTCFKTYFSRTPTFRRFLPAAT